MSEDHPLYFMASDHRPDLLTGLQQVTITRASGETYLMDMTQSQMKIVEEHPPVDRMEGDWGAICEVFRKKSDYFVTGITPALAAGDVIALSYTASNVITLRVVEIEGGRARVERVGLW